MGANAWLAMGLAVACLALALGAAVLVLTRDDDSAKTTALPANDPTPCPPFSVRALDVTQTPEEDAEFEACSRQQLAASVATGSASLDATNAAKGPCVSADFSIENEQAVAGRTYRDGEELAIEIEYEAPGCVELGGFLYGHFLPGTPWYDHFCTEGGVLGDGALGCEGRFRGSISTDARLAGDSGSIVVFGQPGSFPPPNLETSPNLEGFTFCGAILTFKDGRPDGSRAYKDVAFDVPQCAEQP